MFVVVGRWPQMAIVSRTTDGLKYEIKRTVFSLNLFVNNQNTHERERHFHVEISNDRVSSSISRRLYEM